MNGGRCKPVTCGNCARCAAVQLPDGSIQVQSRHGGATHYTVISVTAIIAGLPIKAALRREVLEALAKT